MIDFSEIAIFYVSRGSKIQLCDLSKILETQAESLLTIIIN